MTLGYSVLDVFTHQPFQGNPLAVFYAAEHLNGRQMPRVAAQMNLSETLFIGQSPGG